MRYDKEPNDPYNSAGVQTSGIVCTRGAELLEFEARNNSAGLRYLMFFNHVAIPADGQTYDVVLPVPVPAGGMVTGELQAAFNVGLCWCSSTTDLTKTITAAADMIVTARYRQMVTA